MGVTLEPSKYSTCTPAHRDSFGMVLINPNSDSRRKSRPGANSSTFIFTDTAKLSEGEGRLNSSPYWKKEILEHQNRFLTY